MRLGPPLMHRHGAENVREQKHQGGENRHHRAEITQQNNRHDTTNVLIELTFETSPTPRKGNGAAPTSRTDKTCDSVVTVARRLSQRRNRYAKTRDKVEIGVINNYA